MMSLTQPKSLRWQLVRRLIWTQAAVAVTISVATFGIVSGLWFSGVLLGGNYELTTIDALKDAIGRDADGKLSVANTQQINYWRTETPDFWFIIRDAEGHEIREGTPPSEISTIYPNLHSFIDARFGVDSKGLVLPSSIVKWVSTPVGRVQMITSGRGRASLWQVITSVRPAYELTVYLIFHMTIATLLVTPFVVRRTLKKLDAAADDAKKININEIVVRLSSAGVPLEVLPLVSAVNDALDRLEKGYESHKRFLVDAAHELRTPIAILTTRLSGLPPGQIKNRLLEDSARLTALTGQLLDLQRLEQQNISFDKIDLVALAERVVSDLAPLAFGAGYEMDFDAEAAEIFVSGDQMAIERALTNLLQNAINYGGRQGTITVRVSSAAWIEVSDEGPGVPVGARETIFEPFHRLKQDGRGVGLGLDLVQKIMRLHGGCVELVEGRSSPGACFRLTFPSQT